jgi:glycosyltransferase involved in cell wall biosynthesis
MVIAVNTRFLLQGKLEGIGWFTYETVKHMVLTHPKHTFVFLFDRPYSPQFIFADNVIPVVLAPQARHPILWYIWFEISIPRVLKQYKADVFLSPDCYCSLSTKVPTCMVLHDLAFLRFPDHINKLYVGYLKYFTKKFVQKAKTIVAVSTFTKADIIDAYKIPENKIHIVYNGANELYQPLSFAKKQEVKIEYANGTDYFVYAGSLHPRKNIINLLKAFAIFKKKTESNIKLLLIGRYAWKAEGIKEVLSVHPYVDDIIRYDYMDANELCNVIGGAYAMLYVSVFEGFGIPILEAMKCNVPSVVGNNSSMPEVVGNAGLLVDANNVQDIAEKMGDIYKNENLRNTLVANCAAQASKYSWSKSGDALWQVILRTASAT